MGNFESVKSSNESTGIISRVGELTLHSTVGTPSTNLHIQSHGLHLNLNLIDPKYNVAMGNFESVKSSNESTGIISRVGENVTHLQPGDKVICLELPIAMT
jgi:hypothetical protein